MTRRSIPPALLLDAYASGWFPMAGADGTDAIHWFSPDPRGILPLDGLRTSRRLRRSLRARRFRVTVDEAFGEVIRACAARDETWISQEIVETYRHVHTLGYAHSVETWLGETLVGGLYGVALGGAFFGESMFHRATDASKAALVALVERLRHRGFTLLDVQWVTPHLGSLGAVEISRSQYLERLAQALGRECHFEESGRQDADAG